MSFQLLQNYNLQHADSHRLPGNAANFSLATTGGPHFGKTSKKLDYDEGRLTVFIKVKSPNKTHPLIKF